MTMATGLYQVKEREQFDYHHPFTVEFSEEGRERLKLLSRQYGLKENELLRRLVDGAFCMPDMSFRKVLPMPRRKSVRGRPRKKREVPA